MRRIAVVVALFVVVNCALAAIPVVMEGLKKHLYLAAATILSAEVALYAAVLAIMRIRRSRPTGEGE